MKVGDCANVYPKGPIGIWWKSRKECDMYGDLRRVAVIRIKALKHDKA